MPALDALWHPIRLNERGIDSIAGFKGRKLGWRGPISHSNVLAGRKKQKIPCAVRFTATRFTCYDKVTFWALILAMPGPKEIYSTRGYYEPV
jgi:hypothetical protein